MINKTLFDNWMGDLRKPNVDKYERAELINEYMKENNLSIRRLAETYGLSKSSIEDWLLPLRMEKETYRANVERIGETKTYRLLRETKSENIKEFTEVDIQIENLIFVLVKGDIKKYCGIKTKEKLEQLQKAINAALFRLEKID